MKAKKVFVKKLVFPKLLLNSVESLISPYRLLYTKITEEIIAQALMIQVATKVFGSDKINFQIMQIIWN